jgi:dynein heavy chain
MTTFVHSEPTEFTKIESWLVERAVFRQIAEMKFFKKFKSWKVLKMWRRNILSVRREEVTASLRSKLFIGDPVFGKILMQHRYACKDLEKLRILDFQSMSRDALTIDEVQRR